MTEAQDVEIIRMLHVIDWAIWLFCLCMQLGIISILIALRKR